MGFDVTMMGVSVGDIVVGLGVSTTIDVSVGLDVNAAIGSLVGDSVGLDVCWTTHNSSLLPNNTSVTCNKGGI